MTSTFDRYAGSVHQLIRFAEVRKLFEWHISRWRRKKALTQVNKVKAEDALKPSARRNKVPADWPYCRVGIGTNSRLIQVPPELLRKVEKRDLMQDSLRNRLSRRPFKDFTPSERFTLLAQIHDACYANPQLGPTDLRAYERGKGHYLAGVMGLEDFSPEVRRLTTSEATRLNDILAFVLIRIEGKGDPATEDDNGELLVDVIGRLRRKWGLPSSRTVAVQSQIVSAKNLKGRHSQRKKPRPAHRPPNSDPNKDAKIREQWQAWRAKGNLRSLALFAKDFGYDEPDIRAAFERVRSRRKKAVK